ncbi:hypothetical protein AB9D93_23125, partial [Escherichia coli]
IEAGGIMMPGNPIKISGCADPHVMPGAATLDQHGEQMCGYHHHDLVAQL